MGHIVGEYSATDMPYPWKCILCGLEILIEHILECPKIPVNGILRKISILYHADKHLLYDRITRKDLKIYCFGTLKKSSTSFILTMYKTFPVTVVSFCQFLTNNSVHFWAVFEIFGKFFARCRFVTTKLHILGRPQPSSSMLGSNKG